MFVTRRHFIGTGALALAWLASRPSLFAADAPSRDFRALGENFGVFTGRGGTIAWLETEAGLVVVDSQFPETAKTCLGALEARRPEIPLAALFITHHHLDHVAGNSVFAAKTDKIVAHARVPELQRRQAEERGVLDQQVYPSETFEESYALDLGSERVVARHRGPAHTGGDALIHFERAGLVHLGDLVFNRWYPFIDRPGGASIRGWIATLDAALREYGSEVRYVFGHGHEDFGVVGGVEDIRLMRDYLEALLERAAAGLEAGRSREEIVGIETLAGFPDHVSVGERLSLRANLEVALDELEGSAVGS